MSYTTNLNLFKHDNPNMNINDFDIEKALNENWDKIDEFAGTGGGTADLIEALTTPVTGEGESLSLDNTAKKRFDEFVVGGNTKQATRSGKNLLQNKQTTSTINGLTFTVNEDKSVTVTGTATANTTFYLNGSSSYTESINAGTYVFSDKEFGDVNTCFAYLALSSNDSVSGQKYFNLTSSTYKYRDVVLAENNAYYVAIRVVSGATINKTFYLQLEAGSTATEYEPYGVSPSPDYPAEIENVDNNNPNIFDSEDWYRTLKSINSTDMQKEIVDGIEYYKFKPSNIYTYEYMKGQFKTNTQYVFTAKARQYNQTTNLGTGIEIWYTDGTKTQQYITKTLTEYDFKITSVANKTIDCIRVPYAYDLYGLMRNMQIQEGTIATPYQPFGIGYFTTKVENEDRTEYQKIDFPLLNGQVLHAGDYLAEDGIHHVRKQVVYNGTENWGKNSYPVGDSTQFYISKPTNFSGLALCSHFSTEYEENGMAVGAYISVFPSTTTGLTTVELWKTWLQSNPVTLEYELLEEEIEPYTDSQKTAYLQLQDLRSYKDKTYVYSTDDVSPIYKVEALQDLTTLL